MSNTKKSPVKNLRLSLKNARKGISELLIQSTNDTHEENSRLRKIDTLRRDLNAAEWGFDQHEMAWPHLTEHRCFTPFQEVLYVAYKGHELVFYPQGPNAGKYIGFNRRSQGFDLTEDFYKVLVANRLLELVSVSPHMHTWEIL